MPWERDWYFVGDFDFNCGVYGVIYKVRHVGVLCLLRFPLPPAAVMQCIAALEADKCWLAVGLLLFKTLLKCGQQ